MEERNNRSSGRAREWYFDQRRDDVRKMLSDRTGYWFALADRRLVRMPDEAKLRAVARFSAGDREGARVTLMSELEQIVGQPIPRVVAFICRGQPNRWDNVSGNVYRPDSSGVAPFDLVSPVHLDWLREQWLTSKDPVIVGLVLDERHPLVPLVIPERPRLDAPAFETAYPFATSSPRLGIRMRVRLLPWTVAGEFLNLVNGGELAARIGLAPPAGCFWVIAGNSKQLDVAPIEVESVVTGSENLD